MKNRLKRYIISILNEILVRLWKKKSINKNEVIDKVLVLPPDEFGSIGDEAMIISVIQNVKLDAGLNTDILSFEKESWNERLNQYEGFSEEIVIKSKFANPFNLFKVLKLAKQYKYFVIIGADILDGHYSSVQSSKRILLGRLLSDIGTKVIVTGSSFNKAIHPSVTKELQKVTSNNFKLNIRDLKSYERISKIYPKATLTMDIAFLLKPKSPEHYKDFISFEKQGEYLSININPIHYEKYGESLLTYFIDYIKFLISTTSYNVILVPHDVRENTFGKYSDYEISKLIYNKINLPSRVFFFENKKHINAATLKHVAYNSKIVITGRMHYSIAALSNSVPVLVMTYQGKFEGMLLEIYKEVDNYVISSKGLDLDELKTKSFRILNNLEQEKALINQKSIKNKSKLNLDIFSSK
ncbi:polysaccharide pyruvyl transferase family protein [Algibacter pectinivorans]|uniref:Polysaccharide pyruvyl transferase family protein WcaK n=1 Tax=Algibacter pectinivorans TaxID=870482 RepID=A0A1I1NF42_9FLAO|nr:polysaccharide pyruvyl transferase family protein [Algibacter pectinivorans]SFC96016.1 Polysaccharide pyruvyl transferase family protein WcaK [Algibacter pectinivorans]